MRPVLKPLQFCRETQRESMENCRKIYENNEWDRVQDCTLLYPIAFTSLDEGGASRSYPELPMPQAIAHRYSDWQHEMPQWCLSQKTSVVGRNKRSLEVHVSCFHSFVWSSPVLSSFKKYGQYVKHHLLLVKPWCKFPTNNLHRDAWILNLEWFS